MGILDDVSPASENAVPVESQARLPGLFAHAVKPEKQAKETVTCKGKSSVVVPNCTQYYLEP